MEVKLIFCKYISSRFPYTKPVDERCTCCKMPPARCGSRASCQWNTYSQRITCIKMTIARKKRGCDRTNLNESTKLSFLKSKYPINRTATALDESLLEKRKIQNMSCCYTNARHFQEYFSKTLSFPEREGGRFLLFYFVCVFFIRGCGTTDLYKRQDRASIIWAPPEIEAGSYAHLGPNL